MEEILQKLKAYERAVAFYWRTKDPSDERHADMKELRAQLVLAIEKMVSPPSSEAP